MNILDYIILIILVLSVFGGIRDGFIKKLFMIAAIILAFIFGMQFSVPIAKLIMKSFGLSFSVSILICYIGIFIIFSLVASFLHKKITDSSKILSMWDKIGGAILGVFESLIILSIILLFLNLLNFPSKEIRESSLFYNQVFQFAPQMFTYFKEMIPGTEEFIKKFKSSF